ncbi:MAG: FG-GAP repeat protein [Phycisphaerales bacterium]|nr:FG-GAP repeat protein [Phycisphaerales bacterium]
MRYLTLLLAAAASVLSTAPAHADLGDELFKLLPSDGAEYDHFGYSVAISGTTAIVGVYADDDNGEWSGSAYLFDISDPVNPTEIVKLLPGDGAMHDYFGYSVAISGATAIAGAPGDDDNGIKSGSAYLFDTTTGQQVAKLLPSDGAAGDRFGISVAVSGTIAIVGARYDDDTGYNCGSAYLFDISDPADPTQVAKLLASDGEADDWFGRSVAIDGATAIVGAHGGDDDGYNSGSAYLFDVSDPADPTQLFKLLASDGVAYDYFGYSVAIGDTTTIVGAYYDDDNGDWSGSAYLFKTTTGQQIAKLLPNDGAREDYFGHSVAISSGTAIVGASYDDDNGSASGSAYLFDSTTGQQIAKLLPSDGAAGDGFGVSVAINGTTAIVGAFVDDGNGPGSGSAYLFDAGGAPCPGDLDGDGDVDQNDLGIFLAFYNIDDGGDLDGDGDTDQNDLGILLAVYGLPCP